MRENVGPAAFASLGALGIAAMILAAPSAFAEPITYTDSFAASGTLGAVGFTDANVVITVNADTADVTTGPQVFGTSASVQVAGLGTATLTDSIEVQADVSQGYIFITDVNVALLAANLTSYLDPSTLLGYDLTTSIGPVTTYGYTCVNPSSFSCVYPTSSGGLEFTALVPDPLYSPDPGGAFTFTAITAPASVPEPSSLALLAAAFASLGLVRRRRSA